MAIFGSFAHNAMLMSRCSGAAFVWLDKQEVRVCDSVCMFVFLVNEEWTWAWFGSTVICVWRGGIGALPSALRWLLSFSLPSIVY